MGSEGEVEEREEKTDVPEGKEADKKVGAEGTLEENVAFLDVVDHFLDDRINNFNYFDL